MMGIGASISLYTETPAVTIEDFMFERVASGEVAPLPSPKDNNDAWDLDGTDFTPEAAPDDEGFWDDFENVVLNGDYEELGSELVTNGGFDTDSNWTFAGTNGSISNGVGVFPDTSNSFIIQSSVVPASVKTYKLVYEVTKTNEGALFLSGGSSAFGTVSLANTVGTHTKFVTSNGTQRNLQFSNQTHFVGEIDNISLKQVDPNDRWTLDSGWSIEDGKLKATSTALEATQTNVFTPGNTYEITFTIDSIASGSVKVKAGTSTGTIRTSAGTYTQILDVAFGTSLVFDMHASGTCVIDNVIVKEYAITPLDV